MAHAGIPATEFRLCHTIPLSQENLSQNFQLFVKAGDGVRDATANRNEFGV